MYCKHCGKNIDNDSKFCVHCGTGVTSDVIISQKETEIKKKTEEPVNQIDREIIITTDHIIEEDSENEPIKPFNEIKAPLFKTAFLISNFVIIVGIVGILSMNNILADPEIVPILSYIVIFALLIMYLVYFVSVFKLKKISVKLSIATMAYIVLANGYALITIIQKMSTTKQVHFSDILFEILYLGLPIYTTYIIIKNRKLFINKYENPLKKLIIISASLAFIFIIIQAISMPRQEIVNNNSTPVSTDEQIKYEYVDWDKIAITKEYLKEINVNVNDVVYFDDKDAEMWSIAINAKTDDYTAEIYMDMSSGTITAIMSEKGEELYSCSMNVFYEKSTCLEAFDKSLIDGYYFWESYAPYKK